MSIERLSENQNTSIDVTLEITRKCPLRCVFCSSNGGFPHSDEINFEKWISIVDESIELGGDSFLISGGEPFASPFLVDLARYIVSKNVDLSIYSSGNIGIDEIRPIPVNELQKIASLGNVRMVISLEASDPDIHDKITLKKNSYQNTVQTIKNCIDLNLYVELHFVPTKINYKELPKIVELASALGVKKVSVLRFVPQGRGKENREQLELNASELAELRTIFLNLEKHGDFVRIGSPFNPFLLSKQYKCTAGTDRITIRYDGLVAPCEAFKFILPNYSNIDLTKTDLHNIWIHSKLFSDVRQYQKIFNNMESRCFSCLDIEICGGGCPAQKILYNATIDPICKTKIENELMSVDLIGRKKTD
jgi:radical SAM protein with 4Fe4S-binding SPASM domain